MSLVHQRQKEVSQTIFDRSVGKGRQSKWRTETEDRYCSRFDAKTQNHHFRRSNIRSRLKQRKNGANFNRELGEGRKHKQTDNYSDSAQTFDHSENWPHFCDEERWGNLIGISSSTKGTQRLLLQTRGKATIRLAVETESLLIVNFLMKMILSFNSMIFCKLDYLFC